MKVKRALLLFSVFTLSFLISLYLTFPFEKIAEKVLVEKGFHPQKVSFYHFPPRLTIEELPFSSVTLKSVSIEPKGLKRFLVKAELCGGNLEIRTNTSLERVEFTAHGLEFSRCPLKSDFKLLGKLDGKGYLVFRKRQLTDGKGEFTLSGVRLKNVRFGIFSFKELDLGEGRVNYSVIGKNYLKVSGELNGKDAQVEIKGNVSYNPKNYMNSYVNLNVSVNMKTGKLKGQKFRFTVRGSFNSLRFY